MWKKKGYWIKILTLAIILYVFKHKSLMDTITLCTVYGSNVFCTVAFKYHLLWRKLLQ